MAPHEGPRVATRPAVPHRLGEHRAPGPRRPADGRARLVRARRARSGGRARGARRLRPARGSARRRRAGRCRGVPSHGADGRGRRGRPVGRRRSRRASSGTDGGRRKAPVAWGLSCCSSCRRPCVPSRARDSFCGVPTPRRSYRSYPQEIRSLAGGSCSVPVGRPAPTLCDRGLLDANRSELGKSSSNSGVSTRLPRDGRNLDVPRSCAGRERKVG